eukprot:GDKH01010574.1.p1 GENE.GDKH01010574.1~~GDKH01010574.1.p1  ORF type:complete len:165 (+),score=36.37 GDKH01010574.1:295-789(+)
MILSPSSALSGFIKTSFGGVGEHVPLTMLEKHEEVCVRIKPIEIRVDVERDPASEGQLETVIRFIVGDACECFAFKLVEDMIGAGIVALAAPQKPRLIEVKIPIATINPQVPFPLRFTGHRIIRAGLPEVERNKAAKAPPRAGHLQRQALSEAVVPFFAGLTRP